MWSENKSLICISHTSSARMLERSGARAFRAFQADIRYILLNLFIIFAHRCEKGMDEGNEAKRDSVHLKHEMHICIHFCSNFRTWHYSGKNMPCKCLRKVRSDPTGSDSQTLNGNRQKHKQMYSQSKSSHQHNTVHTLTQTDMGNLVEKSCWFFTSFEMKSCRSGFSCWIFRYFNFWWCVL